MGPICPPAPDPGTQCLNSFKNDLKDPDSGKVISFEPPILTYTATNTYGARTQGKAHCTQFSKDWKRDLGKEKIAILNRTADKMGKSNDCRAAGGTSENCAGDSLVLQLHALRFKAHLDMLPFRKSAKSPELDINALNRESATELGLDPMENLPKKGPPSELGF